MLTARRTSLLVAVLLATLVTASAAMAGGWAVIRLDTVPTGVRAGESMRMGFTVLQHGRTPAGMDVLGEPPRLTATPANGSAAPVTALGRPDGPRGHYVVEVTFPSSGSWSWTITPGWLAAETTFRPLTVAPGASTSSVRAAAPSGPAPPARGRESTSDALWPAALVVPALGIAVAVGARRLRGRGAKLGARGDAVAAGR